MNWVYGMKFRFRENDIKQNRLSRVERAKGFLLDDKPFTKALVLRGSHYQVDAYEDLESMTGRIAY
jgi:hypothetical protein